MNTYRLFVCYFLILVMGMSATAFANNCPGGLNDRADVVSNPPGIDYDVYFTDDDATDPDFFDATRAGQVRDALSSSHNLLTDATRNFTAPFFSDDPADTCISDSANLGTANNQIITLDSPGLVTSGEPFLRNVVAHELFHHTQFGYINFNDWPSWGAWTVEATARLMEDKLTNDNDTTAMNTFFVGEVNGYLGNTNRTLFDLSYPAVVFWHYLSEQLGTPFPEPARGVDFIQRFWQNTQGNSPDSVRYLRDTIESFATGVTLEDMFVDFAITNYTHDLNTTALADPAKYQYFDESAAGGGTGYNAVTPTAVNSFNTVLSDSVVRWGIRYFEAPVSNEQGCEAVGFWGKAKDGKKVAWSIVTVKNGNIVSEVYRSIGNEFYRAVVNAPGNDYDRMALVVAGLGSSADFDYAFGWGPISGEIRRPTLERMAYVGEKDQPERFQTRLLLQGPSVLTPSGSGNVSMRGLDPTLFEVTLRSVATGAEYSADIVNANYVSGEYWLNIQAPVITNPADGDLYDLEICFCRRSGACTSVLVNSKSVLYADLILNQMMVMDISGSMAHPGADPKIVAAQNAARLYVDAADDDDLMGFATFSGNDSECDDDATLEVPLGPVLGNRGNLVNAIDAQGPDSWTSIGDGILAGRNELFGASGMADRRSILLMSDGLENEGDFWATANGPCGSPPVKNSFDPTIGGPAADMRIDTLAFGADADQTLLQNIANFTDGDFYAVSTDTPSRASASRAASSASPPSPSTLQVANRLANAYRTIAEEIHDQDRLYYRAFSYGAGQSSAFIIPITEADGGGVERGVFSFNWDRAGGMQTVTLFDPDRNVITAGTPGWGVDQAATNKVYRFDGVLQPGDWTVEISAASDLQLIAMLSGRIRQGVDMDVTLSQVPGVNPQPNCAARIDYLYLRGLPVAIAANLADKAGPVTGLNVEAVVETPDGQSNTFVLFDDGHHDDGLAGDGIYGNATTRTPNFSIGGVPDFPDGPPTGQWGSYSVEVRASGRSNFGETFERNRSRSFQVFEFGPQTECMPDTDGDDLPDRWEDLYGLDKTDPLDALEDPDFDGLSSKEEFWLGTLPLDADTDNGGEADGSEVAAGRDPLYVRDDKLPAILDYGVVTERIDLPIHEPQPKTNILHFPVNQNYAIMRIFRNDPSFAGFSEIDAVDLAADPSGVYYDRDLQVGFVYKYYLIALGLSGASTDRTEVFGAMAKDDALSPKGWLKINNGLAATTSPNVILGFDMSADATQIIFSQSSDFAGAAWQALTDELPFTLTVPGPTPFVATVFAKYRDASNNESSLYHDTILVDPNADNDGDGVPDTSDNCTLVPNADQRDTNGDGFGNICDADLNNDLIVNILDLGIFRGVFFSSDADADFNGDGVVNVLDLGILRQAFFGAPGPAGPVP